MSKYGLSLLVTVDDGLKAYLAQVLSQLSGTEAALPVPHTLQQPTQPRPCPTEWLSAGNIQKLVVVINGVESGETLERWVFNIETDAAVTAGG